MNIWYIFLSQVPYWTQYNKKQTPCPESTSELHRLSDRRLSAKLVPTFTDRGVSCSQRSGSPVAVISGFLVRTQYNKKKTLKISYILIFTSSVLGRIKQDKKRYLKKHNTGNLISIHLNKMWIKHLVQTNITWQGYCDGCKLPTEYRGASIGRVFPFLLYYRLHKSELERVSDMISRWASPLSVASSLEVKSGCILFHLNQ
jgi:hypothetical protein